MVRSEQEIHSFYDHYAAEILMFCRLFFGDEIQAEEATKEAFLAYVRGGSDLDTDGVPTALYGCALAAVRDRCSLRPPPQENDRFLKDAILFLPCDQRVVFILRFVIGLNAEDVATATGLSRDSIHSLAFRALMQLRTLLPREFKETKQ